MMPARI
ncbi:hypothetical protein ACN38_g5362, partial [Penicillium nordicum]